MATTPTGSRRRTPYSTDPAATTPPGAANTNWAWTVTAWRHENGARAHPKERKAIEAIMSYQSVI
jgi:hypothetical protein